LIDNFHDERGIDFGPTEIMGVLAFAYFGSGKKASLNCAGKEYFIA
jgi:hypothetical protein